MQGLLEATNPFIVERFIPVLLEREHKHLYALLMVENILSYTALCSAVYIIIIPHHNLYKNKEFHPAFGYSMQCSMRQT